MDIYLIELKGQEYFVQKGILDYLKSSTNCLKEICVLNTLEDNLFIKLQSLDRAKLESRVTSLITLVGVDRLEEDIDNYIDILGGYISNILTKNNF